MTAVSERSMVDQVGETPATAHHEIPRASGLTARGVKARLTRAGVDYSALIITEHDEVSRMVDVDHSGPWRRRTVVKIQGPREALRTADNALFWSAGSLSCSPCGDVSTWSR